MRAWVLTEQGPIEEGPLRLVDVPAPRPGPHEVRVRVTVCGICRTDIHIAKKGRLAEPNAVVRVSSAT